MASIRTEFQGPDVIAGRPSWIKVLSSGARSNRLLIKVCTGLSLLLILFTWFDFSGIASTLFSIDAHYVLLAIIIFILQFALSCARWMFILKRQKIGVKQRTALSIYGVGTLANLFLVTSIAGMSVRAALLVRRGAGLSGALASLAAERLAAIAGLALCGGAGLLFALPMLQDEFGALPVSRILAMAATGLAIVIFGSLLAHYKFSMLRAFFHKVWNAFSSFGSFLFLTAASAGVVLLGFIGMAILAGGIGLDISPVFFISVMPAIAFVSALPISVGGWGVREGMMVAGLAIFSVPAEAAVALSISYGLAGVFVAVLLGTASALMGEDNDKSSKPI
jgi:uncharacterized membrane protein YbhN (UPF0104 family)